MRPANSVWGEVRKSVWIWIDTLRALVTGWLLLSRFRSTPAPSPPGPAPREVGWFTRRLERWEEVAQRIEEGQAEDAGGK